jgi:hypothetical protein
MAQNPAQNPKRDTGEVIRKDTDVKGDGPARREKDVVTEGSEDSFPASDPPSYMGGSVVSGSPPSRKSDEADEKPGKGENDKPAGKG